MSHQPAETRAGRTVGVRLTGVISSRSVTGAGHGQ
jgi:hypothetical protein